jgi:hypothetical protein
METVSGFLTRVFRPAAARREATRIAGDRDEAVDVAVEWWVESLRGRDGVSEEPLARFAAVLRGDLVTRLAATYRVYLEVGHQPKGVLRDAALTAGLDLDSFPPATTMAVGDAKVEVAAGAQAPYEQIHGQAGR